MKTQVVSEIGKIKIKATIIICLVGINSCVSKTAEFIGMERSALHRKLKSLGIKGIN